MKIVLLLLIFLTSFATLAHTSAQLEETLYQNFKSSLSQKSRLSVTALTSFEQSLYVDAIWDLVSENSPRGLIAAHTTNTLHFDLVQKLRLAILTGNFPTLLQKELINSLLHPRPDLKLLYTLAGHEDVLLKIGLSKIVELAQNHPSYYDVNTSGILLHDEVLRDLVNFSPPVDGVKIFMFCRQDRSYPCLMAMRDMNDQLVLKDDGQIWTQKALAASSKGLPGHVRNGSTPSGVLLINSVMPYADEPISFGKFRRIILDFIDSSPDEKSIKELLPPSSRNHPWWKQNVVAREAGRNLLRIHGTGKINDDPQTPYFPFVPTSGCIAQRENTYNGVTYQDQRELLDWIMEALGLYPTYENEAQVKGVLYLVEIDDKLKPVELEDLLKRQIFYFE